MKENLEIINKFNETKIMIIGDIILDKYVFGKVDRISPEAPIQVVNVKKEKYVLGGASNTAKNVSSLGANAIIIGIVGEDEAKEILKKELIENNIESYLFQDGRKTIQKIRVIGHSQQLLRIDYEQTEYLSDELEEKIFEKILEKIDEINGIIISDYAKGVITQTLMKRVVELAKEKNKVVSVDPKPKHSNYYKGCSLITPNQKEASEMCKEELRNEEEVILAAKKLSKELDCNTIITRGEQGISLLEKTGELTNIPTKAKEVYDVSGAGDTVIATMTLSLCAGADYKKAAYLANHAAGVVVGKLGTASLTTEELIKSLEKENQQDK